MCIRDRLSVGQLGLPAGRGGTSAHALVVANFTATGRHGRWSTRKTRIPRRGVGKGGQLGSALSVGDCSTHSVVTPYLGKCSDGLGWSPSACIHGSGVEPGVHRRAAATTLITGEVQRGTTVPGRPTGGHPESHSARMPVYTSRPMPPQHLGRTVSYPHLR